MNEVPRQKLRELVAQHGQSLGQDARRCEGLLRDYCGEHRREISVLVMAVEEHIPPDLLSAPAGTPREALLSRLARRLSDNLALSEPAAKWAVNSWALALGVISDAELKAVEERAGALAPEQVESQLASQIVVSASGGGDVTSISDALSRAAVGSRILVRPGEYFETVILDKQLEVVGDGPREQIIIRGTASGCIRVSADGARIAGLSVRGAAESFAVEVSAGKLLLEDCDITSETLSCVTAHGDGAELTIRRCRIHDGKDSGVYFFDGAKGAVESCEIFGHANVGVAVTAGSQMSLKETKIHSGANAGLAVWGDGLADLERCEIYANRLAGLGVSQGGKLTARACRIFEGSNSGVFVHQEGDVTIEECDVSGHRETELAVESGGQLTAVRCRFQQGRGTGVFVRDGGQALLRECGVEHNVGAGVSIGGGSLAAVLECHVRRNGRFGVEVAEGGIARVSGSDLVDNKLGPWLVEDGAFVEGGGNSGE